MIYLITILLIASIIFNIVFYLDSQKKILLLTEENQKLELKINDFNNKVNYSQQHIEALLLENTKLELNLNTLKENQPKLIKESLNKQRSVIKGQISEEVVPLLADFPYKISDLRFSGNPVDFLLYDGYSDGKINKILFLEVKTGVSSLSKIQNEIKRAVEDKRVFWETFKVP